MGLVNFKLTSAIIEQLIAGGCLTGQTLNIPLDAKVLCWHMRPEDAPLGEIIVTLQHDRLWRVSEGAEIPRFEIMVKPHE